MIAITKTNCDQIRCIAGHFSTAHVLRRAGEEFSEATTAIIHYTRRRRRLRRRYPDAPRWSSPGELADTLIMLEQLLHVVPDLQRLVTVQVAHKVNRTLKRYDIKVPAGGAGRDAAKEID